MNLRRSPASISRFPTSVGIMPLAVFACAALLAACGGSSGGADVSAHASRPPTPVPSPLITSGRPPVDAVAVARMFWTQVGEADIRDARSFSIAPGSPLLQWTGDDIAEAKLLRVLPHSTSRAPAEGATMEFAADVWIRPSGVTPWGDPGKHTLFMNVLRMSDGSWRMWDVGTGP